MVRYEANISMYTVNTVINNLSGKKVKRKTFLATTSSSCAVTDSWHLGESIFQREMSMGGGGFFRGMSGWRFVQGGFNIGKLWRELSWVVSRSPCRIISLYMYQL